MLKNWKIALGSTLDVYLLNLWRRIIFLGKKHQNLSSILRKVFDKCKGLNIHI